MDGAQAIHRNSAICANVMYKWVAGRNSHGEEASGVSLGETAVGADLGVSSKYSNVNFEDWSGEWFHVNSIWTWVSRS